MPLRLAKPKKDRTSLFGEWLADAFVIPSGISRGKPFTLHPFQEDFVRAFLSRDLDGPTFRTCIFSTPRKLGKSTLLGAVLLGHLCPDSPLYIPHFTAAVAAPTEKHAGYISTAMLNLMEFVEREDELDHRFNPRPGKLVLGKGEVYLSTGDIKQGHGMDLDLAVIDETGLIAKNQGELITAFFDALATKDGQLILTGTRGDSPAYNELIDNPDKRTHVTLYAAEKEDDPSAPATWQKANPGLGAIKSRRFLQDAHGKALQSGSLTEFEVWHLNKPLSPTRQLLLDYATLAKSYRDDPQPEPDEPVHVGIDLGGSASMTAATIAYEHSGLLKVLGAFPGADLDLVARGKRDMVGDLWHRAALAGDLIETSGSVSDLQEFLPELIARIGNHPVASVSCDRYRQHEFETALARAKISWPIIYRGTGPKDGDADIRATRRLFLAGAVQMQRSILLEGSIGEADVRVSATGATQLDKSHLHARIDVAQSLCLACSALLRARETVLPEYSVEVL
ncbi:terminase TerL endonuclease subunit [Leisingera thetidis]|uniref:terminase TerL endonuclease subunit n=1 Tax=Leisingera thetidis TaxID=2930199 RepID=UPI0021F7F7CB|nr:terminase TerL endonuclease subunit [Leisingera thetidis]